MPSKKIILLITLFSTASILPMDLPTMKQWARWIIQANRMLLGQTPIRNAHAQLTIDDKLDQITNNFDSFQNLTKEDQKQIILLLSLYENAGSLSDAGNIINSLARLNTQLNSLINDPDFCLKLIKHLSYEFKVSNEAVCKALQTDAAKKRLALQQSLAAFCKKQNFNQVHLAQLINQHPDLDLNFTYTTDGTPLIIAVYYQNYYLVDALIDIGANPLIVDTDEHNALDAAKETKNDQIIKRIEKAMKKE